MDQQNSRRIVEKQQCNTIFLKSIYNLLKVNAYGNPTTVSEGRIATNIIQETDKGRLVIRMYPKQMTNKLETGHPLFEVEALKFYADHDIKVPVPLKFQDEFYLETEFHIVLAYFFLSGRSIKQSELTISITRSIGEFLNSMLKVSVLFSPSDLVSHNFLNSFEYCLGIAERIGNKYLDLKELDIWNTMKEDTYINKNILDGTPKGIVHADFFFENILINEDGKVIGLIDFGDAYFGYVVHDLVIGAMESCVLLEETWNLDIFSSFLEVTSEFLKSYCISFEQFYETLKADCFRFALYTLSLTDANGKPVDSNNYIKRYETLLHKNFKQKLYEIYVNCIKI